MTNNKQSQQPDFLSAQVVRFINFCKAYRQAVFTGIGVLALVLIIGGLVVAYNQKAKEQSWSEYYNVRLLMLQGGNVQEAFDAIDQLQLKYKGKDAALYAQLLKGDVLYMQEEYAKAAEAFKPLLSTGNKDVNTLAALSLAASQQAAKEYAQSVSTIQTFIQNNPTSFALPQAYFTLALSQELAGNKEDALQTYQKILESYTKTYYGNFAKDKITQLRK